MMTTQNWIYKLPNIITIQLNDNGFNFCEGDSSEHDRTLTCSHIISVKKCQESGRSELAYDPANINILCMKCHRKLDGLDLRFKK
jgi:5-methylcytosine-specific restriction endonuclease McrA